MDGVLIDQHVREIVATHFDPKAGAPYWLERQKELAFDARREIRGVDQLGRLGPMDEDALRHRSVLDFVPLSQRGQLPGAIITETGGTTGTPKRTIFSHGEFEAAFVTPFVRVADAAGFPRKALWLWVGPSGPHVIGLAAAACAAALESPQPFCIDLDPRWYRKTPADSMSRERYLRHLIDQAVAVLRAEPVEVLFTTPIVLERLAGVMSDEQRRRIRGVHYGGMRVAPELLHQAQCDWFPHAVHLAGYGNSLFGVCMEFGGPPDRKLRYFPSGARHLVSVDQEGRVCMSRLDRTVLIPNLRERDTAAPLAAPGAPWDTFGAGVEDPRPYGGEEVRPDVGIY